MPGSFEDTAFRKLIEALFEEQRVTWSAERPENKPSRRTSQAKYALSCYKGWAEISNDSILPTKEPNIVDFARGNYLMPLLPLEKDDYLVPWLSISYRQSSTPGAKFENACCRIYVLMLGQNEDKRLFGIGFRIESPEKNCQENTTDDDTGRHDFYHAQLIKSIRTHGPEFDVPDWLPCRQPSFPLWAINPVDALLNLILTLYGTKYYKDFLRKHGASLVGAMSKEFRQLNQRLRQN